MEIFLQKLRRKTLKGKLLATPNSFAFITLWDIFYWQNLPSTVSVEFILMVVEQVNIQKDIPFDSISMQNIGAFQV